MAENYLNPKQAAAYLSTSPSTLAKRRIFGGGPPYSKIGRIVRYRRTDLDDYMAAHLHRSTFSPVKS